MRSDYYDGVSQAPLRPLPPQKGKKKKRKALRTFVVMICILAAASIAFAVAVRFVSAPAPSQGPAETPEASGVPKTTIRRLFPPGEGSMAVVTGGGEELAATEIYERILPGILTVTALDDHGAGGEGTGVIFDDRGYFVTNSHVIEGTSQVFITLSNGREYPAYLIGMDKQTDLAVLKFSAQNLTAVPFGSDAVLKVGEPAYALGNPLGSQFNGSMTDGIISAINRNVVVDDYEMSLIQTTAELNQGNSGGALVDSRGRVIGITNMKMMSSHSTVEGLGFAIPTTTVVEVVNELMTHGHVTGRPMLGITVRPATPDECSKGGLFVESVEEASDAWSKGIRPGHIILAANGNSLYANRDLLSEKGDLAAGEGLLLRWLDTETGQEQEAEILLVEQYLFEE